jgi:uncharacterized protein
MARTAIDLPQEALTEFCRRWHIRELALFGSILRDDFSVHSDVDVLVSFSPHASWGLLDHVQMEEELSALLGRPVDLLSRKAVEHSHNWLRRREILRTAEVVYEER